MATRDPNKLKIRNRRRPRWGDLLGGMLIALAILAEAGLFFVPRQYHRACMVVMFGAMFAMVPFVLYGLFQIWDLKRPIPSKPVTVRVLFEWLVLGIRRPELGPADGWTFLTLFRPMLSKRYLVGYLVLGEEVEVDNPIIHYPANTVKQIRFAPDPEEDYIGAEAPIRLCEAIVEMDSGREFRLIVTDDDAQQMRQWAVAKAIGVCDCGGYVPRSLQSKSHA